MRLLKSTMFAIVSTLSLAAHADLQSGACSATQQSKVVTTHQLTLKGVQINYNATVGYLEVTAADNTSKACVFYTSYEATSVGGVATVTAQRPVTFAFNGGPGSASLWLHMGFLGPERVDMGPAGLEAPNPISVINNDYTPLDATDIVMIDPVATGFSFAEAGSSNDAFFGVMNDFKSISSFVQNYLSAANRWLSPKFILGESYGGVRGPLLTQDLQADGVAIDGLILVSPALSYTSLDFSVADLNVPYWTFFPNMATSAWYHQKASAALLAQDVATVYQEAQQFADTTLRNALDFPDNLSADDYNAVVSQITNFTGLPAQFITDQALKITDSDFFGGVLNSSSQVVGRYDARFVAPMTSHQPGQNGWIDPSDNMTSFPFTAAINSYLRTTLGFTTPSPYNTEANIDSWPYSSDGSEFSVISSLGNILANDPRLNILISSGYYDLACPMGTVDYEITQVPGGKTLQSRIAHTRLPAGHMSYINPVALQQMKSDTAAFIVQQSGGSARVAARAAALQAHADALRARGFKVQLN